MAAAPLHASVALDRVGQDPLPPVVVLAGAERWFREEMLRAIVARVFPTGDPGASVIRLDASKDEDGLRVTWAVDEVRTPSLFGEGKVVAIDDATSAVPAGLPAKEGRKKADPLVAFAGQVLGAPPTGSILVLLTPRAVKGKTSIDAGALEALGARVVDCRALYDSPGPWARGGKAWDHELSRWLQKRMKALHGKALGLPEAHAMALRVGTELGPLEAALRTLALYVGERPSVGVQDVATALGETREDPSWVLVDAVLAGDLGKALPLVAAAFDRGLTDARGVTVVRPDALFHMLTTPLHKSFLKTLQGAEGLARGEDPEEVARAAGVPPFLSGPFLDRCRRDPREMLRRHGAFLEAEMGVKGGGVPARLAFERLVLTLAAPTQTVAGRP